MKYSHKLAEVVCERIACSMQSLERVCSDLGVNRATVWRWRREYPEFEALYTAARQFQAELIYDLMMQSLNEVPADQLSYLMKKLQVDTYKAILLRGMNPVRQVAPAVPEDGMAGNLSDAQFRELLREVNRKNNAHKLPPDTGKPISGFDAN